jgi:hypothetical protein
MRKQIESSISEMDGKKFMGEKIFVMSNLRNATSTYSIPTALQSTVWTDALNGGAGTTLSTQITLQPYSFLVLKQ